MKTMYIRRVANAKLYRFRDIYKDGMSKPVDILPKVTVFALVKNECKTDCFPSLEKARQL